MNHSFHDKRLVIWGVLYRTPKRMIATIGLTGHEIREVTKFSPGDINSCIISLHQAGYVHMSLGRNSEPYDFKEVEISDKGKSEYEKFAAQNLASQKISYTVSVNPIGSPYGFIEGDWKKLEDRRNEVNKLYIIFGYQFKSRKYNTNKLVTNIKTAFDTIIKQYIEIHSDAIKYEFKPLAASYGEHLFNEIARDIISSDIAVFDTSDLNPNVMLEIGVALTWGVQVFLIKHFKSKKPPSDISGQTWADYKKDGLIFIDSNHDNKLIELVERAISIKRSK